MGISFPLIKCPVQAAFKAKIQQNQKLDFTRVTQDSEIIIFNKIHFDALIT